jgi:DNA-binding LytR/AlgR family response regulator
MPGGMTGIEMAKIMLKASPNSPILLATGYTEKVLKNRIEGLNNIVCVSKPYDTNKLPELISSLIQNAA